MQDTMTSIDNSARNAPATGISVALWIVQSILAALFLFAGVTKFTMPLDQMIGHWQVSRTMGVMARQRDARFVITSDRQPESASSKRAPKNLSDTYLVWTGESWSSVMTDAEYFDSMEAAEEYIRANADRVMKYG